MLALLASTLLATQTTALVGGTLIDGYGAPPVRNSVVLIEGQRIARVGRVGEITIPAGATVISTEGMTVLPGLWDMHVHLMIVGHADYAHWDRTYPSQFESVIMPAAARQLLMAGVTSARDLGGPLEASLRLRDRVNQGEIPGPTLYVSGPFIQHEPYPGTELFRWGVTGDRDAREKVRRLAEGGVNVIKLIDQDQMTMEEVRAVVDEAHRRRLSVIAHAHRPEEIRRGIAAGVDGFEHTGMQTAPEYPGDVMAAVRDRTAQGNRGPFFWTPTISPLYNYDYLRDNREWLDDPSWHVGLPEHIIADIKQSLAHWDQLPYYQMMPQRRPTLARKFQQLRESGAILLIGTDSGVPGNFHSQSTWQELDSLGQCLWLSRDGSDPGRDLLARRGDGRRERGGDGDRGEVCRHHCRARRSTAARCHPPRRGSGNQARHAGSLSRDQVVPRRVFWMTNTPLGPRTLGHGPLPPSAEEHEIMGMPETARRWTAEMVRALPDDGNRYEVVDGELFVTPAPRALHQRAVGELLIILAQYVRKVHLGEVMTSPADIEFREDRLVQPDVFVLPFRPDGRKIREWSEIRSLLLAVEVLSPSTARADRQVKRRLYQEEPVSEYWIVDLDGRVIERWRRGDERPEVLSERLVWQPDPRHSALEIDLLEFFREVLAE